MSPDLKSENLITQYLLGELREEQQVEIEDRALAIRNSWGASRPSRNDLIDEYVRGELSAADRAGLNHGFWLPSHEEKESNSPSPGPIAS
jgi:anti-sigma factor RsiW